MPVVLTQAEIDALLAERTQLQASVAKRQDAIDSQDDVVQAATDADNAEKKAFDFYDLAMIRKYEDEREELDGTYVELPVLKSELDEMGQLTVNRLTPSRPDTKPVRIPEFDSGGLITTDNDIAGIPTVTIGAIDHEPYWIDRQAERETWLQSGFGGTTPTITPTTTVTTAITPATTQIDVTVTVPAENPNFTVGDRFLIINGAQQIAVEVTNIVSQTPGVAVGFCTGDSPPGSPDEATCIANGGAWTPPSNYTATLDITQLAPGTVAGGGSIDETWAGFSNADRTAKNDTTDGYNNLMTNLINDLDLTITNQLTKLNNQKTALIANEDPNLDPQAEIDVDAAIAFLTTWQVSKDIDDTELASLASQRATRSSQTTARITAISGALTAPTNLLDARYTSAVNIADTSRGTVRIKIFREGAQGIIGEFKVAELARIQAIEDLLTLAGVPF